MAIFPATEENISKGAGLIRSGEIVSFPTETVYGLGADALNPIAVAKIFEAKERPHFDPLIVHICEMSQLEALALNIPDKVRKLTGHFWPGPLTIILDKTEIVPDIVTSGLETVAVRMPSHPVALELIKKSGTPIAAPSANPFGYLSPTRAEHVQRQLGERVPMIIDGGTCQVGVESTIMKFEGDRNLVLRPGGVSIEEIESIAGKINVVSGLIEKTEAPGQLPFHYSPITPVEIFEHEREIDLKDPGACFLFFKKPELDTRGLSFQVLSEKGDMREAAANLFVFLHKLDNLNKKVIYAQKVPETGLGLAIMDRLAKASKRGK